MAALPEGRQPVEVLLRSAQPVLLELQPVPVVGACQKEVPDRHRVVPALYQCREGDEVAAGLGHLRPRGHHQVLGMEPVLDEGLAGGALRLRDFVLVVGEFVVNPAAM